MSMMYGGIDRLQNMMGALSNQQKVISNNVANWQTPGYVRQQYHFSDVLGNLNNPYETALSTRMGSLVGSGADPDGKPVDLTREMIDMQKGYVQYAIVASRLTTVFNNIRRAATVGR